MPRLRHTSSIAGDVQEGLNRQAPCPGQPGHGGLHGNSAAGAAGGEGGRVVAGAFEQVTHPASAVRRVGLASIPAAGYGARVQPGDEVLREIGRVAIAAAQLDYTVVVLHGLLLDSKTKEVMTWSGGQVRREVVQAGRSRLDQPLAQAVEEWVQRARGVLEERHTVMHSLSVMLHEPASGTFSSRQWDPREDVYVELKASDLYALALRLGGVNMSAYGEGVVKQVGVVTGLLDPKP